MLQAGKTAPQFELPDADMNVVSLAGFRNRRNVVVFFYPRNGTPSSTQEAIEFSDLDDEFTARGAVVLGISTDDCMSHGTFRDQHGLSMTLLSDADAEVCERYCVMQDKEVEGRKRRGILRSTFVIDRKGVIRHALYGVEPRGHAEAVLDLIEGLGKCK